jgi:hypothetical protein
MGLLLRLGFYLFFLFVFFIFILAVFIFTLFQVIQLTLASISTSVRRGPTNQASTTAEASAPIRAVGPLLDLASDPRESC